MLLVLSCFWYAYIHKSYLKWPNVKKLLNHCRRRLLGLRRGKNAEINMVYINDLIDLLAHYNIKVKLFADDVKLYVKIFNAVDVAVLHQALAALVSWADEWQLSVSVAKCGVLCIGKDSTVEQFSINNISLPIVTSYSDLGVTITSDLSPSFHIDRPHCFQGSPAW